MARKILLLCNSPKAQRYFSALRDNISTMDLSVEWIGVRGGPALAPGQTAAMAHYTMLRKRARYSMSRWKLRWLQYMHERVAQWHYHSARARIERLRPDAIGVWGGQSVDVKAAITAAADLGVPAYVFECGLLPGTTTCDPRGVNADNSVPRDAAFYANFTPLEGAELPQSLVPRRPRTVEAAVALPERYVFVPLQVRLDSQVLLYSPWVRDMRHLFQVVVDAAAEACVDGDVHLVFKQHPSCSAQHRDLQYLAARTPRVMFANGNNTQQLIDGAQGVITINSTVGIESLLRGRPVLALGQACYAVPGVAEHAAGIGAVIRWLGDLQRGALPPAIHREVFLRYLAERHVIPGSHTLADAAHCSAVAARLAHHPGVHTQANTDAAAERVSPTQPAGRVAAQ